MSDRIDMDLNERFFEKDGKYYVLKSVNFTKERGKLIWEQVDRPEYEKFLKSLARQLVQKSGITATTIVLEALRVLSKNDLMRVKKRLGERKPVKVEQHCLRLHIGKEIVQLVP